ncbi:MAG: hypothetical protein H6893_15190 [Brucellaceae bacterium]|nr:hypothetical protein [Brucellaceae bacterium]
MPMVVAMSWMLLHDSRGEMLDIAQIDNQHVRRLANALRQFDGEASGPGQNAGGVEDAHQALVAAVRMGAFADELLRKLRGGKSLGPHEPHGWGAIPRQLCEAAKLPTGRCVSLACLRAQGDDVTTLARECGITPQTLAVSGEPAQPADATAWRAWLMEIPREELPQDIADALSNGNLPVNQTVVAAKGVLHAIWPALVRRAADFPNLAAAELPALVTGVVADEARRSARAAQIVAVAALAAELPASAKAFLERQVPGSEAAFSKLSASAGALKPLFDDPQNLIRLPDDSDAPAMAGAEAIEKLRAAIVDIVPELPEIAAERVVEYVADQVCPQVAEGPLHPIATRPIAIRGDASKAAFEFALRETGRSPDGEISAELVAAISAELKEMFDGDGNPVAHQCIGELRQVFPLGIVIRRLRERDGKLFLAADDDELIQRAEAALFRSGIVGLANRLALPITWPAAVEVEAIVLEFKPDFHDVALKATLSVPLLDHRHQAVVPLVVGGRVQDDPDVVRMLGLDGLVASLNREIADRAAGRRIAVGPFRAEIEKLELATTTASDNPIQTRTAADKRWLSARARLTAGPIVIDNAWLTVVERGGQVRFVPAIDLTPLFRAALDDAITILAEQGESLGRAMLVHLDNAGEAARPFVGAVSRALMIQRVDLDDSGQVNVTLALDIGMIAGQASLVVEHSGPLDFDRDDLGLPPLYKALAEKAVQNGTVWINEAVKRIDAAIGDLVDAEVQNALNALTENAAAVGIKLTFDRRDRALYDLEAQFAGVTTRVENVRLTAVPPDLDFRDAEISSDAEEKLTAALIARFNELIPLDWVQCGSSRISKGATGIVIELGIKSDLAGCLPLPAVVFDGRRLSFDKARTEAAILAVLQKRLATFLPEDIAGFVGEARFADGFRKLAVPFEAEIPGLGGLTLSGTATVDLKSGSFEVKVDDKDALFNNAFRFVAGNIGGDDWKVEPLPDQIGVIASGRIDFGVFGVGVEGLQVTTRGIHVPELAVRLPAAIPIGPITIFPVEVKARVQRPYSVTLIGDVGLFGASSVAMLRGSMGFDDIPPKQLSAGGTIIVLSSLELFRTESSLRFSPFLIKGTSETVGLMKAVMPFRQTMRIDAKEAVLTAKATILGIHVDGSGRLTFSNNPSLTLAGKIDAGSLAEFSAGVRTDLFLTDPTATVDGRVGFLLGDIEFGADANLRRARLSAKVIGIRASVTVPSLTHIDTGMIEALFAFLLKPSIDLSNLRELNVQVSPRIAGGSGGSGEGEGEGAGEGGGLGEGGDPNPAKPSVEGGQPVTNPPGAIPSGTVPSEWQSGWVSGDGDSETFCWARWKGPDRNDPSQFQWLDDLKTPRRIAELRSQFPPVRSVHLGWFALDAQIVADGKIARYKNCSTEISTLEGTSVTLYLPGDTPLIWASGARTFSEAPWVGAVLDKVDGPDRAADAAISRTAADIIAFMYRHKVENADTIQQITLAEGRQFWIVALPEDEILVRDPEGGAQIHERSSGVGQWLAEISDGDAGSLAERLLPALFLGRGEPIEVYARKTGDATDSLLLGHVNNGTRLAMLLRHINVGPGLDKSPFVIPLSRGEKPGCSAGLKTSGIETWRGNESDDNASYANILTALIETSPACDYWNELQVVGPDSGEPERLILVHGDRGDWNIAFTDSQQKPVCLRTGLNSERLETALDQWRVAGAITDDEFTTLLASGYAFARLALSTPEPDWRGAGFPFNPLILASCEGG